MTDLSSPNIILPCSRCTEDLGEYPAAADVRAGAGVLGPGPGDHQPGQAAAGPGRARVLVILS